MRSYVSSGAVGECSRNVRLIYISSQITRLVTMSEELSGFPTLKPAIVTKVDIRDVHDLGKPTHPPQIFATTSHPSQGTIHNGSKLTHYVSLHRPGNRNHRRIVC